MMLHFARCIIHSIPLFLRFTVNAVWITPRVSKNAVNLLRLFKHHSHEGKRKEEISRYCHNLWHFYLVQLRFTQLKITSLKAADKVQNVSEYGRSKIAKGDSQVQETFSAVRTD